MKFENPTSCLLIHLGDTKKKTISLYLSTSPIDIKVNPLTPGNYSSQLHASINKVGIPMDSLLHAGGCMGAVSRILKDTSRNLRGISILI